MTTIRERALERVQKLLKMTDIEDWPLVEDLLEQLTADLGALQTRNDELELACAQAVEFATYVEEHAKGKMEEAARRFLSMPFAQELAGVLKAGREAVAREAAIVRFQEALDAAADGGPGGMRLKVLSAEFRGDELEATIVDGHDVRHVGARFSERRTLADLARVLQAARSKGES